MAKRVSRPYFVYRWQICGQIRNSEVFTDRYVSGLLELRQEALMKQERI